MVLRPLPSSRTPVGSVRRADVRAAKREQLTKAEIVHRLGKPDVWYADLKVACYKLNDVSRRRLVLLFGVVPIGVPEDNQGLEVAMFQFDVLPTLWQTLALCEIFGKSGRIPPFPE